MDRSGEIQDNDSTEESMLFSPTLPEIYYTVGKDKVTIVLFLWNVLWINLFPTESTRN